MECPEYKTKGGLQIGGINPDEITKESVKEPEEEKKEEKTPAKKKR